MFFLFRLGTSLVSLLILGVAAWLLWSWQEGRWVLGVDGVFRLVRDDWRLWTGGALMLMSFLGRFPIGALLGSGERNAPPVERAPGHLLTSPTGSMLHVEVHGRADGPTIILTHGWGLDGAFWRYTLRSLEDRCRLVVWDLPGLGRSRAPRNGEVSLDLMARDLAAVMEDACAGRCVLVGHSIGGMVIQTLLRERPELDARVAGVALFNTTWTNPLRTMILARLLTALQKPVIEPLSRVTLALWPLAWLMAWQSYLSGWTHVAMRFGFGKHATRGQIEQTALTVTRNSPKVQTRGDLAMFHWDSDAAIARTAAPVLVVAGDMDILTKAEAGRALAGMAKRGRLEVVSGANHMGPMGQAERYNQLLADFVLSLRPAQGDAVRRAGRSAAASSAPPEGDQIRIPL